MSTKQRWEIINEIIHLKQYIYKAESQLLKLAKEKYHHTTEMAKALEVNQSTISRKLRELRIE